MDDLQSAVGQSIYGEVQNVFCDFLPWHRDYLPVLTLNKANIAYSIEKYLDEKLMISYTIWLMKLSNTVPKLLKPLYLVVHATNVLASINTLIVI